MRSTRIEGQNKTTKSTAKRSTPKATKPREVSRPHPDLRAETRTEMLVRRAAEYDSQPTGYYRGIH